MAGVNFTSEFLGFHEDDFAAEDITAPQERYIIDNIPLPAHEGGEASFTSLSFDSEVGYGEKVEDYKEEIKQNSSVRFYSGEVPKELTDTLSYLSDNGISTPFVSPVRVVDSDADKSIRINSTFKSFNSEKTNEIPHPEMDFSFTDVHSPEPARKFIERSLHDIDDIINDRRLQLSEMRRMNAEKVTGEVPEYANPLHYSNYKKLQSPLLISSSEKPQSQFSSPTITIPRRTYDSIRDGERSATHLLKTEQEKMKRLEVTIQELEDQCVSFTEKIRVITDEKNRMANRIVQADEDARDQNYDIMLLKEQLQMKDGPIVKSQEELGTKEKIRFENYKGRGENTDISRESKAGDEKGDSRDSKDAMTSEDIEKLVLKCDQLVEECALLSRRCEDASIIAAQWAETATGLEEQRVELEEKLEEANSVVYTFEKAAEEREVLEIEKAKDIAEMWQKEIGLRVTLGEEKEKANSIAHMWQKEAGLFEEELAGQVEMLQAAQEDMQELEGRVSQSDVAIAEKDKRISELSLALSNANERQREIRIEKEEMERNLLAQMSKNSHVGGSNHFESPLPQADGFADAINVPASLLPLKSNAPLTTPLTENFTEELTYGSFWSEDQQFDAIVATPNGRRSSAVPSSALSKQPISASLAKRVLITWDRTPVRGHIKDRRARTGRGVRAVSQTNFLVMLALFQVTVWFLLLLASYLYFADFKSCKANKVRYTH